MSNIGIIGLTMEDLYQEIRRDQFRTVLKDVFWNQVAMDSFRSSIKSTVKDEATTQAKLQVAEIVRDKVVAEVNNQRDSMENKMRKLAEDHLKKFVAENHDIHSIIEDHKKAVKAQHERIFDESKAELERLYREHLTRIVEEDKYQTVNAAMIDSLRRHYAAEFEKVLKNFTDNFIAKSKELEDRITTEIQKLHNAAQPLYNASVTYQSMVNEMSTLRSRVTELQHSQNVSFWINIGLVVILGATGVAHWMR